MIGSKRIGESYEDSGYTSGGNEVVFHKGVYNLDNDEDGVSYNVHSYTQSLAGGTNKTSMNSTKLGGP